MYIKPFHYIVWMLSEIIQDVLQKHCPQLQSRVSGRMPRGQQRFSHQSTDSTSGLQVGEMVLSPSTSSPPHQNYAEDHNLTPTLPLRILAEESNFLRIRKNFT